MKQVTYEIRGLVIETMIPAITASCESLFDVRNVRVSVSAKETGIAIVSLILDDAPDQRLEDDLGRIMTAKGLELVLPAKSVRDLPSAKAAAVPPAEDTTPPPAEPAPQDHAPSQSDDPAAQETRPARHYVAGSAPKPGKQVSMTYAIATVVTAVVLAVLLTFSVTRAYMKQDVPASPQDTAGVSYEVGILDRLFRSATVLDLDDEAIVEAVLRAYIEATGDPHASYYNAEEFAAQQDSQNGSMYGIGVTVENLEITVDGESRQAILIVDVYQNSPAEKAGLKPGDAIVSIGKVEERETVQELGYLKALDKMAGDEGTTCDCTVLRGTLGNADYTGAEEMEISAVREKLTTPSVVARPYAGDPTVGVVRIIRFNNTTCGQFSQAIEDLKAKGCQSFVLDLRNNPGGLLTAVEDVLVYFLNEGDTMISIKDNSGKDPVATKLTVSEDGKVLCGSGQLTKADVGRYRGLKLSVLVNESSASAAELFTANIRDHGLGAVVGVKTYGKGSMQTTFSLAQYGHEGALKLTTAYYYPPSGQGYDGKGILPTEGYAVELDAEAQKYSLSQRPHEKDNQLTVAVSAAKSDTPNS